MVELLVATIWVPGSSLTKKLVHAKWIAFAICLFLNDHNNKKDHNFDAGQSVIGFGENDSKMY